MSVSSHGDPDHSHERKIHDFPVFPGADQYFCIDKEDFTVVHEILDISGINYKLTKVQSMVSTDQELRVYKLCMPDNDKILTIPPSICFCIVVIVIVCSTASVGRTATHSKLSVVAELYCFS